MSTRRNLLRLILLVACTTVAPLIGQATVSVPGQFATIQSAINAVPVGTTVLVSPGLYSENLDFLGKNIIVRATGGPGVTTIDGGNIESVVTFVSGETRAAHLEGFTIQGGLGGSTLPSATDAAPGGILCVASAPSIINCVIANNAGGTPPSSTGQGRRGGAGGAACYAGAFPLFFGCRFDNNIGGDGENQSLLASGTGGPGGAGALQAFFAFPDFVGCVIEDNQGGNGGSGSSGGSVGGGDGGVGGLCAIDAQLVVVNCRILGNSGGTAGASTTAPAAGGCGAIGADDMSTVIGINSILAQNVTGGSGTPSQMIAAAILNENPSPTSTFLLHCTIADNDAPGAASIGGISASGTFINGIIWNNTGGQATTSLSMTFSDVFGGVPGMGNVDINPLFVDPPSRDYTLRPNSGVRDIADLSILGPLDVDVDNDPRVVNMLPDMGADEVCLEGTNEDFMMFSLVAGGGDPTRCVKSVTPGQLVTIGWDSPLGTFDGSLVVILAQIYGPNPPPLVSPASAPGIHVNPFGVSLVAHTGMLPPGGDSFSIAALTLPPGTIARVQAILLSNLAQNLIYASSRAHDFIHL